MQREFRCSKCKRQVLDIQLFPNPVLLTLIGVLSFPKDFICAYCKDTLNGKESTPDYLLDGEENTEVAQDS